MRPALAVLALSLSSSLFAAPPGVSAADERILSTLRPGHPRLFALEADVARMRGLIAEDEAARKLRDEIRANAVRMLDEPPVEHKLIGPRLLQQSRACLGRVATLAALYRLEGDRRFAERAEKEMLTAAAFPDWNPSHFLDTAEMSNALGIGYDWLFDFLSPKSREAIRTAIVKKGLEPGLKVYRNGEWWAKSTHNWNQVCNGGLTVGALAIADEEPAIAAEILTHARKSIPLAMKTLVPDGGWPEGPGYWNYAMRYTAYYHAALLSALDTDFGLKDSPGYADTGRFRMHFIGPTMQTFNFADGGAGVSNAAEMHFFARTFDRPIYAWHQRRYRTAPDVFDLIWYDTRGDRSDIEAAPLDGFFRGVDVVFLRSEWDNPEATFVGFKGGDNAANHSNLDLGTFVLDAQGRRWAVELGADDYNLPGYWSTKRWTYYRLRTEGQNTLVLNGENQATKARAPIAAFKSTPDVAFAVADLSAGYAGQAREVRRGIALLDRRHVLVQDEVESAAPARVAWGMHTSAEVSLAGRTATLALDGKQMFVHLLEPAEARWDVREVKLEPPQRPLKGIRKLTAQVKMPGGKPSPIRVLITPSEVPPKLTGRLPAVLSAWAEPG